MLNQRSLTTGLWAGLWVGFSIGFLVGQGNGLAAGIAAGLLYGLPTGLATALVSGLSVALADTDSTSSPSPADSWHSDQRYSIAVGLAAGIAAGLGFWFFFALQVGVWAGLGFGVWAGLWFGFLGGLFVSQAWRSSLAAAHLARRWHTPAHLMRLLNDARERNVLRTVGPVYQFRHALLQDRLAAAATSESCPHKRDHGQAGTGGSTTGQDRQDQDR